MAEGEGEEEPAAAEQESRQSEGPSPAARQLPGFLPSSLSAERDPDVAWQRWQGWRRRLLVAAGGYASFAVFAIAVIVLRSGWPDLPWPATISLAAGAAILIGLALLWERIRGFKFPGRRAPIAQLGRNWKRPRLTA